ncbi:glutaredoxin family protein [Staphylococcus hominis]|uniref:glutaredoxin family protein n=1 Tax=Staphylococcus hominis TaxID=1290 RepID=UPI001C3D53FB|nr:glutaredoxin domain-containing protein [Staphylococcus hominis]MBV5221140.1 glutaredoxin family protein [Staphylococcus hominis]MCI2868283.1 glutaredoxin family protein [Staphylococcus hominis]MDS3892793.1 glutaredoxin domain-containing protein [Staphylococcus hominis]
MSKIIIYTQDDCPPCNFLKNYLTEQHINFIEKNIKYPSYRNEMLEYDAFSTPFILLNEEPMYHVDLEKINKIFDIQL